MTSAHVRPDAVGRRSPGIATVVTWAVVAQLAVGCGDDDPGASDASTGDAGDVLLDVIVTRPTAPPIAPATECVVTTARRPSPGQAHHPACSALDYPHLPATGGDHYSSWADFGAYTAAVPWGFLVHAMEQGGVVLLYNCTDCAGTLADLRAFYEAQPADRLCSEHPSSEHRLILAPAPDLPVPIAAAAWERLYTATCFDAASLRAFVDSVYGKGPEDLCARGVNLAATGWCDGGLPDGGLPTHDGGTDAAVDASVDAAHEDAATDAPAPDGSDG